MTAKIIQLRPRKRKRAMYDDDVESERRRKTAERHYKWQQWQQTKSRWGGGHRKRDGRPNALALASFNIDRVRWCEHEYQQQMARKIVEVLFENQLIAITNWLPHWPYRQTSSGEWKHMTDKMIKQMLNQHLAFTRDYSVPVNPPDWLPQAVRFAVHDMMYIESEEDEEDED
jgi:hypothetical protein